MRFSRFLLLPFVCMGLMAALTVFSPMRAVYYGGPMASAYDNIEFDLTMPAALIDRVAIIEEAAGIGIPTDAHRAEYTIANQPLAAWRMAADAGYQHIDPGRRAI